MIRLQKVPGLKRSMQTPSMLSPETILKSFIDIMKENTGEIELSTLNITFNSKAEYVDFFMMMYLDVIHDETVNKTVSFKTFMKTNNFFEKVPNATYYTTEIFDEDYKTPLITSFINNDIIRETEVYDYTVINGFEAKIKMGLLRYFDSPSFKVIETTCFPTDKISKDNALFQNNGKQIPMGSVLLDMEVNSSLSEFVNLNKKTNDGVFTVKTTPSQVMDPGVFKTRGIGVSEELATMHTLNKNKNTINRYWSNNISVNFNDKFSKFSKGNIIRLYSLISEVNVNNFTERDKSAFELKLITITKSLNKKDVTPMKKESNAEPINVLKKFLGDFYQACTVVAANKSLGGKVWLLTGDGNLCAVFLNLCKLCKVEPYLIADLSLIEKTIRIYTDKKYRPTFKGRSKQENSRYNGNVSKSAPRSVNSYKSDKNIYYFIKKYPHLFNQIKRQMIYQNRWRFERFVNST